MSSKKERTMPASNKKGWVGRSIGLLVVLLLLLNVLTRVISVVRYYGDGMAPTLESGQLLVIDRLGDVSEGDVIAFYYNNRVLVRRVIGTGGKTLSISENGTVSLNGETLEEPYVAERSRGQCDISFPYSIPYDHVFVMGDARSVSMDSRLRAIGTIPTENIIGKVILFR